jgi:hypothetical protein
MTHGRSSPFTLSASGSSALIQFDRVAKEWMGLVAYRLMGKIDALFPEPYAICRGEGHSSCDIERNR